MPLSVNKLEMSFALAVPPSVAEEYRGRDIDSSLKENGAKCKGDFMNFFHK